MKMKPIQKNLLEGGALIPSVSISNDFAKSIEKMIDEFHRDIAREIKAAFKAANPEYAMDGSFTFEARKRINALKEKWQERFNELAKSAVDRMIRRIDKNSSVSLNLSLKNLSDSISIDTTFSDARLADVIQASTQEAAQLIKRIPAKYLDEVQGQVMRSITSGNGMKDLVPYLTKKYKGDIKWARHVALDQTRKAYTSINTVRLQNMGVEEFKWVHTGGSAHPRKEHIALSGKIFRYDDPPVIDPRTGERGLPSVAPFCRCIAIPVIKLVKD